MSGYAEMRMPSKPSEIRLRMRLTDARALGDAVNAGHAKLTVGNGDQQYEWGIAAATIYCLADDLMADVVLSTDPGALFEVLQRESLRFTAPSSP